MSAKKLFEVWVNYLFQLQSPVPIAIFRIMLGLLILEMSIVHVGADVLPWYSSSGPIQFESIKNYYWHNNPHFDLFLLFPPTDAGVMLLWNIFVCAAFCLTIGLFSRTASIIVCFCMISLQNHQPFNLNGGDTMLRLYSMYLMFSDSGAAISVDRMTKRYLRPTFGKDSRPNLITAWGQRMIQIQLALAYWSTFEHKIAGKQWVEGTAVYYATRLDDMARFQMPLLYNNPLFCQFLTWYTLVVEGSMWSLVWFKEFRYFVLAAAVVMHLGIDYSINLPVFEWAFMAGFITFVPGEDLTRFMDFLKTRITIGFGPPVELLYNQSVPRMRSIASLIEGLDVLGRLSLSAKDNGGFELIAPGQRLHGFKLFSCLTCKLPLLWFLAPFLGWFSQSTKTERPIANS